MATRSMTRKNPAAVALGKRALGVKKTLNDKERKRRADWARNLHRIRK